MKALVEIPAALVAYARLHEVCPIALAQECLGENAKECGSELLALNALDAPKPEAAEALALN